MLMSLEQGANDLHMAQLTPLPPRLIKSRLVMVVLDTSGYAMVVHGRPQTPKNRSLLGVTQPPGVAQPLYSR